MVNIIDVSDIGAAEEKRPNTEGMVIAEAPEHEIKGA